MLINATAERSQTARPATKPIVCVQNACKLAAVFIVSVAFKYSFACARATRSSRYRVDRSIIWDRWKICVRMCLHRRLLMLNAKRRQRSMGTATGAVILSESGFWFACLCQCYTVCITSINLIAYGKVIQQITRSPGEHLGHK